MADRSVSVPVTMSDLERRDEKATITQQMLDLEQPNSAW